MDWAVIGSIAAVASVLATVAGVLYTRMGVAAQTEPSFPAIEASPLEEMAGMANWYETSFVAKSIEPVSWFIDYARVTSPVGTKIALFDDFPKLPNDGNWDLTVVDSARLGAMELTNSRKLGIALAPSGTHKGTAIMGENDKFAQIFYLFIPPRSEASSISIDLTLRSSAIPDRTFNKTVTHNIISDTGAAT